MNGAPAPWDNWLTLLSDPLFPSWESLQSHANWKAIRPTQWSADIQSNEWKDALLMFRPMVDGIEEWQLRLTFAQPNTMVAPALSRRFGAHSLPPRSNPKTPYQAVFDRTLQPQDTLRVCADLCERSDDVSTMRVSKLVILRTRWKPLPTSPPSNA